MLSSEFFKKWYETFAKSVDKHFMQENVKARGCMPWHIFSYGYVQCVSGKNALDEFLKFDEECKILVFQGFDYEDEWVDELDSINKTDLTHLMQVDGINNEVFITAFDFSWTFVWTHEGYYCGPYLCYKTMVL